MNKVHVAFYKAKYGTWFDKFINFFSGRKGYSHCELVVNKNMMIASHYKVNNIQKFYYNDVYNSKYWDVYELDLAMKNPFNYAHVMIGAREYDSLGVALHFIGLNFGDDTKKVWCSEFLAIATNKATANKINPLIMPNDLIHEYKVRYNANLVKELATYVDTKKARWYSGEGIDLKEDRYGRVA